MPNGGASTSEASKRLNHTVGFYATEMNFAFAGVSRCLFAKLPDSRTPRRGFPDICHSAIILCEMAPLFVQPIWPISVNYPPLVGSISCSHRIMSIETGRHRDHWCFDSIHRLVHPELVMRSQRQDSDEH